MNFDELQAALQYFSKICDERDVPIGIVVTTGSGRFAVKFSLTPSIICVDSFAVAAERICTMYREYVAEHDNQ